MENLTRWWLVRHAPIAHSWAGRVVGRTDVECEPGFEAEAAALARRLPANARWIVSPRARTRQTALALGAESWQLEPRLAEQDFGSWEGGRWSEIAEAAAYWADYATAVPPGGESLEALQARALEAFEAHSTGGDVIAVLHAGPIRALVAAALDMPLGSALKLSVAPLSLSRLEGRPGAWQLVGLNLRAEGAD